MPRHRRSHDFDIDFRQSNHEGHLIDWIHEAGAKAAVGIVLNAGGYTHGSIALRDAIASVKAPVIEVHISNIFAREDFRHHSHIAPVAKATLCGFGVHGYALALAGLAALLGRARTDAVAREPKKPRDRRRDAETRDRPDLIRELARLLDETGLTEIEYERDGARVRVARQPQAPAAPSAPPR